MSSPVIDVTDATFEREVIERSRTTPVVVDFWAPWCGPCRTLGPVLEKLAAAYAGEFLLAKLNVDENPGIAQALGIQGIPAVKAIVDGRIVDEFVGALPEAGVRGFLARILPTEADRCVARGDEAASRGAVTEAESAYRQALDLDVNHPRARLAIAKGLIEKDPQAALGELERVLPGTPERAEADRIAARLRIHGEEGDGAAELERRVEVNPGDLEARFLLARHLGAVERYEAALGHLLEIVRRDRTYAEEEPRRAMLDIFEVLGSGHELVDRYRSELAKVLFS